LAGELKYEPEFPLYIMLEQTYRCNMRCVSCIHGYPHLRKKFSLDVSCMPWELFERIVLEGEKNNCPSISTHNNDEPLLVKDLEKRIAFARQHGFMDVIMTTNGIAFTEERIKGIIDAGVTRILFSIDALTEETYNKVRPKGNYRRVIKALEKAREYRASRGSHLPILRASFVVNRLNQHELKQFIEEFSSLVDYIDVQPFCTYYDANLELIPDGARLIPESEYRCNGPWRCVVVRGNGDVLPCPNFYGVEMVMGNMYQNSIKEIFNSPAMKQLRREFKEGIFRSPACQACSRSVYEISMD
jgi:radical SAM protein with 4Fe4S-binding SPASM domain